MASISYLNALDRKEKTASTPPSPVHILIACMPKSGSTFISDIISQIPGFSRAKLIPAIGRREQELDAFCLQQVDKLNYVGQYHVRYSQWTAQMCHDYNLNPVVLVRSLLDVVISLRDHMRRESPEFPYMFADQSHVDLDDAALERMIVRLAMPWYINFYMSWRRAPGVLMVSYEEMVRAPAKVVGEILAFSGADVSEAEIGAVVNRVGKLGESRLNVGVAGRGAALQPETIRDLLTLLDFYPEAADDPYIVAVRAQAMAALSDGPAAPVVLTLITPSSLPGSSLSAAEQRRRVVSAAKQRRLVVRRLVPALILVLAVLYWLWPNDLLPDSGKWGRVDDAVVLMAVGIVAGRLSRYKPKLARISSRSFATRPAGASGGGLWSAVFARRRAAP